MMKAISIAAPADAIEAVVARLADTPGVEPSEVSVLSAQTSSLDAPFNPRMPRRPLCVVTLLLTDDDAAAAVAREVAAAEGAELVDPRGGARRAVASAEDVAAAIASAPDRG
jgi:hypothetical protein